MYEFGKYCRPEYVLYNEWGVHLAHCRCIVSLRSTPGAISRNKLPLADNGTALGSDTVMLTVEGVAPPMMEIYLPIVVNGDS